MNKTLIGYFCLHPVGYMHHIDAFLWSHSLAAMFKSKRENLLHSKNSLFFEFTAHNRLRYAPLILTQNLKCRLFAPQFIYVPNNQFFKSKPRQKPRKVRKFQFSANSGTGGSSERAICRWTRQVDWDYMDSSLEESMGSAMNFQEEIHHESLIVFCYYFTKQYKFAIAVSLCCPLLLNWFIAALSLHTVTGEIDVGCL